MTALRTFHQSDFAARLRVPEGKEYVVASNAEEIREALSSGRAAYVHSCNGRAFIWNEGGKTRVDHFFMGPPNELDYDDEEEAVDYASNLCE